MHGVSSGWGASLRGIGALIAVTVRYPEVSSVQYDPDQLALTVSFLIRTTKSSAQWRLLIAELEELLGTYYAIMEHAITVSQCNCTSMEGITVFEFSRDQETVSVEEVGMVIEFLRDHLQQDLVADPHDLLEEDLLLQEETIQASLEALRRGDEQRLIALREEGRVLVYNL